MLRSQLPMHVSAAGDHDYGAFVTITETALELETVFKLATQTHRPPRFQSSVSTTVPDSTNKPSVPSSTLDKSTKPSSAPGSSKLCTNCGLTGHLALTCFKPGGGMAGQHDEFKRNRSQVVAMIIASLDEAYDMVDVDSPDIPPPTSPIPHDNSTIVFPVSPILSPQNDNVHRDWYAMRDSSEPNAFSASSNVDHTVFLSLRDRFNTCLDSGCTDYIVQDRQLFQTYDMNGAVDIGTANCSLLSMKASGNISFRLPYQNHHVIFTLRGCLHAPDVPINLISVSALNENGVTVTFRPDAPTTLSYPLSNPKLPGFSFTATVVRRLSFLFLDFLVPDASPLAFPAISFPKPVNLSTLWHRRFGHLSMDATKEAFTKDYATGIQFTGPFAHEHCIACIVGKSPQHSYSHNGCRASGIGELLHMDMCGPYPV